jgi:hypothetical protein
LQFKGGMTSKLILSKFKMPDLRGEAEAKINFIFLFSSKNISK